MNSLGYILLYNGFVFDGETYVLNLDKYGVKALYKIKAADVEAMEPQRYDAFLKRTQEHIKEHYPTIDYELKHGN